MQDLHLDLTEEVILPKDDDPEVLAAIDEALEDVERGREFSLEQVKEVISNWNSKSGSLSDSLKTLLR